MTPFLKNIFMNRNVIMVLAVVTGIIWEGPSGILKHVTLPILGLIMVLATMTIQNDLFRSPRVLFKGGALGIMMTYCVQAPVLVAFSFLAVDDRSLWTGFILLAAVPPAVAVIPFSIFLDGDDQLSLSGTVGAYLAALVCMPLIVTLFLGPGIASPMKLFTVLLELVVGPVIVSRILIWLNVARFIEPVKGHMTNWGFFIVIYTMVALNRHIFIREIDVLLVIASGGFVSVVVLGSLIGIACRAWRTPEPRVWSLILLGTMKNYGLAGGLALFFFDERTAAPATVTSVIGIFYIVVLEIVKKRRERSAKASALI